MSTNLRLGATYSYAGFGFKHNKSVANETYQCVVELGKKLKNIDDWSSTDAANVIGHYSRNINGVLLAVERGDIFDMHGQAIDLRTQMDELTLLTESTRNLGKMIGDYCISGAGREKWNNENITNECRALSALSESIQEAQSRIRREIATENTESITPVLQDILIKDLIPMIGQYMD